MNPQFEQAQQLGTLWLEMMTEMMTKMMAAGVSADPAQPPPQAARRARDVSLEALGQQADAYMRSPQFLELMKQSLDAQIAFRTQLNQFFTQAHHAVQGVAKQDVDDLFLSARHTETRVLDRIEGLCERLDRLSRRLEALERGSKTADGNGHAATRGNAATIDPAAEVGME
jgi:hypothetical protein